MQFSPRTARVQRWRTWLLRQALAKTRSGVFPRSRRDLDTYMCLASCYHVARASPTLEGDLQRSPPPPPPTTPSKHNIDTRSSPPGLVGRPRQPDLRGRRRLAERAGPLHIELAWPLQGGRPESNSHARFVFRTRLRAGGIAPQSYVSGANDTGEVMRYGSRPRPAPPSWTPPPPPLPESGRTGRTIAREWVGHPGGAKAHIGSSQILV